MASTRTEDANDDPGRPRGDVAKAATSSPGLGSCTATCSTSILPTFGSSVLTGIHPAAVRAWHAALARNGTPTRQVDAYSPLCTIMATAVADELVATNPCRVRGAKHAQRQVTIRPATLPELEEIVAAMPDHYQLLILLAAWGARSLLAHPRATPVCAMSTSRRTSST